MKEKVSPKKTLAEKMIPILTAASALSVGIDSIRNQAEAYPVRINTVQSSGLRVESIVDINPYSQKFTSPGSLFNVNPNQRNAFTPITPQYKLKDGSIDNIVQFKTNSGEYGTDRMNKNLELLPEKFFNTINVSDTFVMGLNYEWIPYSEVTNANKGSEIFEVKAGEDGVMRATSRTRKMFSGKLINGNNLISDIPRF